MASEPRECRGDAPELAGAGGGPGEAAQGARELRAERGGLPPGACAQAEQLADRGVAHVLRQGEGHLRDAQPVRGAHEPPGELLVPRGGGGRDPQDAHPAQHRPWQLQRDAGLRPDVAEEEPPHLHPQERLHGAVPGLGGHLWHAELPGGQCGTLHHRDFPIPLWRHVRRRRPRLHGPDGGHLRRLEGRRPEVHSARAVLRKVHAVHDGLLCRIRRIPLQ
mmetsp:Transcript_96759/g.282893  ORF Transcript_96759/g.282893 Transcript_96759/m.282893 type:complete len:220 (+) Transcript_96759:890-1549(+)